MHLIIKKIYKKLSLFKEQTELFILGRNRKELDDNLARINQKVAFWNLYYNQSM